MCSATAEGLCVFYERSYIMVLENDKILIESRREINDLQEMIDCYLANCEPRNISKEDLEKLRKQLDILYMCW